MKFPKEDFPLIRTAVILLVSAVVLSAGSIYGSNYLKEMMLQTRLDDQKHLAEARTKLDRVREEEQQIRLYHAKYQEQIKQGIVGPEKRLDWIEHIDRIKAERKLFDFSYQIAAQQPIPTEAALSQGEFGLYGSIMRFSLSALHEEDWLNTLNDLKQNGVNLLRDCAVSRIGNEVDTKGIGPNLKAECTMIWLSLKPKNGGAPNPYSHNVCMPLLTC